jgi:hypothetical protein
MIQKIINNRFLPTLNVLAIYGPIHNAFDAGKPITRANGRGLGPGNRDFFGAQIAVA